MSTHYLGIDLHKRSSVWVLLNEDRSVLLKKSVPCRPLAVTRATALLPDPRQTHAVLEPVSGWRWYADVLESAGVDVHLANPLKTRLIAESRLKYDTVDARTLAELLRADFLPESYRAPTEIANFRRLIRERLYLVYMRTSVKNRIHGVLSERGLHTIKGNPMRKAGAKELREGPDVELAGLATLVDELSERIKPLDQRIGDLSKTHETMQLLMTMPTVGPITAATVVAEVGDFSRFPSPRQLASYAGLVPSQRSSGSSVRMGHITRTGSRFLRAAIVEAAFRIRSRHGRLAAFLARVTPERGARRARVALARKMLSIMWYMVKNNTPYQDAHPDGSVKRVDLVRHVLVP